MKVFPTESPPPRRLQWIFALTGILLLVLSIVIGYGYYIAARFQTYYSPLIISIERIEEAVIDCHRIAADVDRRAVAPAVDVVLKPVDENLRAFQQVLAAEVKILGAILPDDGLIDSGQIKRFNEVSGNYRDTLSRWLQSEIRTEELKRIYDQSYLDFLGRADEIEDLVLRSMARSRGRFQNTMAILIGFCIVLAVLVSLTFRRYEKRNLEHYFALADAHRDLQEEIRERVRVENELRQGELLFRTVFETSPDPIILTRFEDGCIVDINSCFTELTGLGKHKVIGKTVPDLEIWRDTGQRELLLNRLSETGSVRNREAVFQIKDGELRTALISAEVITIDDQPHILTVVRDITDRKDYEKRIQASIRFLNIANRHTKMRPLLKAFIAEIKHISGCTAVAIRILDEDGQVPYAEADGFSPEFCRLEGPLSVNSEQGMCVRVIRGKRQPHSQFFTPHGSYFVKSTSRFLEMASDEQKQLMRNTCHRFGFETLALIPIRMADRVLGLIQVADPQKDRLAQDGVEILEAASLQLGTAIQRVSVEEALQESHNQLEERVKQRTALLAQANEALLQEIEERKKTEQALLDYQLRLRSLSSELIQTQEQERRLIASEIHDRIGQALAVAKIKLGGLRSALGSGSPSDTVAEIRDLVTQTIRDTRTLTFELSPPVLYELGLQAALEWLADFIRKQSGLKVTVDGDGADRQLNTQQRVFLFRAVRELLYNVVKHAGAAAAEIRIEGRPAGIRIEVADDGIGLDPGEQNEREKVPVPGFGLFGIREQLQYYGGRLEIISEPGKGTRVNIALPIEA